MIIGLKVVLVGPTNSGKSAIMHRISTDRFKSVVLRTIGCDIRKAHRIIDGDFVSFKFWEVSGDKIYREIVKAAYADADLSVVVFDKTDLRSLQAALDWIDDAKRWSRKFGHPPIGKNYFDLFLVGNKEYTTPDISCNEIYVKNSKMYGEMRKISRLALSHARNADIPYFETSARFGTGIETLLSSIYWALQPVARARSILARSSCGSAFHSSSLQHSSLFSSLADDVRKMKITAVDPNIPAVNPKLDIEAHPEIGSPTRHYALSTVGLGLGSGADLTEAVVPSVRCVVPEVVGIDGGCVCEETESVMSTGVVTYTELLEEKCFHEKDNVNVSTADTYTDETTSAMCDESADYATAPVDEGLSSLCSVAVTTESFTELSSFPSPQGGHSPQSA